uniref:Reverse transcriptase zinc-binding domain-containing protein n=1 Tax=Lactuca sativa TaxID=4236 RepID=A0A9R1V693_LACSA|nr:hypothetical protein LSAT_V11C600316660 [Lactuca sativa]
MEGLNIALKEAFQKSIIQGISFPISVVYLSHLFYADDASQLQKLVENFKVLSCGVRLKGEHFQKSKLYCIDVSDRDLAASARVILVGANMGLIKNWKPLIDRVQTRLSSWKAATLSLGRRLTLVKSMLVWDKVIAHKENGGLGVRSLRAANFALLTKWIWRIKEEKDTVWKNVIIAIHNLDRNRKPINKLVKNSIILVSSMKHG